MSYANPTRGATFKYAGFTPYCGIPGSPGEQEPGRGVAELLRADALLIIGNPELFHSAANFLPREKWFPAQAKIQGQAASSVKIILDVQTESLIAIVFEFARP